MVDSQMNLIAVQAIGAPTPSILARAIEVPMRVLVRNTGVAALFVATTTENLVAVGGPTTATFRMVADSEEVFVIAPRQSLYGIALGAGNTVSVAVSEALPVALKAR